MGHACALGMEARMGEAIALGMTFGVALGAAIGIAARLGEGFDLPRIQFASHRTVSAELSVLPRVLPENADCDNRQRTGINVYDK